MKGLLVHGCYDQATFQTLESLGVENFGFDLRARSTNLVTYKVLSELLTLSTSPKAVLVFGDDTRETILSFLDLLKKTDKTFLLEFRDNRKAEFYESLGRPYIWFFTPEGDWENILSAKNCEGIVLPLKYRSLYHDLPHLWNLIEMRHLRIWLHAENFSEAEFFEGKEDLHVSLDLAQDVQPLYRKVDQVTLRTMKLWRKLNESAAGQ